jgi:hypothetical protein
MVDESGKHRDSSGNSLPIGSWNFNAPDELPSQFKLATEPKAAFQ